MEKFKPFNVEAAKAGKKMRTRGGNPARFLGEIIDSMHPIAVAVMYASGEEWVVTYTNEGKFYFNGSESEYDLFMETEKVTRWVTIYRSHYMYAEQMHGSEEKAYEFIKSLSSNPDIKHVETVLFEEEI